MLIAVNHYIKTSDKLSMHLTTEFYYNAFFSDVGLFTMFFTA